MFLFLASGSGSFPFVPFGDTSFPLLPAFDFNFSDDRLLFSSSANKLTHVANIRRTTCPTAAGSLNLVTVTALVIGLKAGQLIYGHGSVCPVAR